MDNIEETYKKLHTIQVQDFIWIIGFFIAIAGLFSNSLLREDVENHNVDNSEKIRNINLTILIVAFLIYLFYVFRSYKRLQDLRNSLNQKAQLVANITFIASILFLVAGAMLIYAEYNSVPDEEIQDTAFF